MQVRMRNRQNGRRVFRNLAPADQRDLIPDLVFDRSAGDWQDFEERHTVFPIQHEAFGCVAVGRADDRLRADIFRLTRLQAHSRYRPLNVVRIALIHRVNQDILAEARRLNLIPLLIGLRRQFKTAHRPGDGGVLRLIQEQLRLRLVMLQDNPRVRLYRRRVIKERAYRRVTLGECRACWSWHYLFGWNFGGCFVCAAGFGASVSAAFGGSGWPAGVSLTGIPRCAPNTLANCAAIALATLTPTASAISCMFAA